MMSDLLTKEPEAKQAEAQPAQEPFVEPKVQSAGTPWRERGKSLLPHCAVLAAMTIIAIGTTWPLFPNLGGYVMDKNNQLYSVGLMAWQVHAFPADPLHIFVTSIMYPVLGPLAYYELDFTETVLSAPFLCLIA